MTSSVLAQVSVGDKGEINGNVFADYYWVTQNHDNTLEDKHGFQFRRIYVTYNQEIDESFSTRFRITMGSAGLYASSNSKMIPSVKDAYLKWKNGNHQILMGISSTPTWGHVSEKAWGYRAVEKTVMDLYGLGSSRDFGISAKGQLDDDGNVNYHVMIGNGHSNYGNEINKGKKIMASLAFNVTDNLRLQVYGDWNDKSGDIDWYTFQGFGAYQADDFTLGALYAVQSRESMIVGGDASQSYSVVSVFSRFTLQDETKGYLRFDHAFEGIPGTETNKYLPINSEASSSIIMGGVDFKLGTNVHLMPNIKTVIYGEDDMGNTPNTDVMPRLTLNYKF
ncbi:MAG: hypothetical protein FH748_13980 [Balneolaceae bacterium]|nr:hypothetical protein [Balneolaceae bacterium]